MQAYLAGRFSKKSFKVPQFAGEDSNGRRNNPIRITRNGLCTQ
jgi:hypothetical protein